MGLHAVRRDEPPEFAPEFAVETLIYDFQRSLHNFRLGEYKKSSVITTNILHTSDAKFVKKGNIS